MWGDSIQIETLELIQTDARHQAGLVFDGFSVVFFGDFPSQYSFGGIEQDLLKVHGVFSLFKMSEVKVRSAQTNDEKQQHWIGVGQ